jgi:hypothetical protein
MIKSMIDESYRNSSLSHNNHRHWLNGFLHIIIILHLFLLSMNFQDSNGCYSIESFNSFSDCKPKGIMTILKCSQTVGFIANLEKRTWSFYNCNNYCYISSTTHSTLKEKTKFFRTVFDFAACAEPL